MAKIPSGASPMMRCLSSSHSGGRSSLHARFAGSSMRSENSRHSLDGSITSRRMTGVTQREIRRARKPARDLRTRSRRLSPLAGRDRSTGGHRHHAGRSGRGAARRLRAQAQLVRPRRRHRALRHRPAAAVRASRGRRGGRHRRPRQAVLRRRQHPDAGGLHPPPQGELLQVHQRDPQRDRGRHRPLRSGVAGGGERNRRRRWLRARPGVRRDRARGRPFLGRVAAGGAAAGGAARHRRAHPGGRQALRAPGPGRRVRHTERGDPGPAGRGLGTGRRRGPQEPIRRGRPGAGPGPGRGVRSAGRRRRHRAHPARPHPRRRGIPVLQRVRRHRPRQRCRPHQGAAPRAARRPRRSTRW